MRNKMYQKSEATKKTAPIIYRSVFVWELLPVNKVNWKDVCSMPKSLARGQQAQHRMYSRRKGVAQ